MGHLVTFVHIKMSSLPHLNVPSGQLYVKGALVKKSNDLS